MIVNCPYCKDFGVPQDHAGKALLDERKARLDEHIAEHEFELRLGGRNPGLYVDGKKVSS
jgi:hypothetical protein